jgi:predicted phage terminase large subunit-like protein
MIPMRYDGQKRKTFLGPYDPRTKKDELLWPTRFPEAEVKLLSKKLGIYGTSGQLQQEPAPEEGGIIKTKFIKLWPSETPLPVFEFILQSYDCAFTEHTVNDYTAMIALGVFEHKGKNKVMLIDAWHEKLEYPELRKRVKEEFKSFYGEQHGGQRSTDAVLIEDKGSGISLRQDLNRAGLPARPYNPGKADKTMRAHRISPLVEAGLLYAMESPNSKDKPVKWAEDCIREWRIFPNAKHDDYVDALTQALIYLQDSKLITIDIAEDEEEFADDRKRPLRNPYRS